MQREWWCIVVRGWYCIVEKRWLLDENGSRIFFLKLILGNWGIWDIWKEWTIKDLLNGIVMGAWRSKTTRVTQADMEWFSTVEFVKKRNANIGAVKNKLKSSSLIYLFTSGTFPAPPGSFLKKNYINMTINIIHVLSN